MYRRFAEMDSLDNTTTSVSLVEQEAGGDTNGHPASLWFESVLMLLVMFVGVPGNILSILVQVKTPRKSSTDHFILTMAGFDLVCSALGAPMFVVKNIRTLRMALQSATFCIVHKLLVYLTSSSTSLLLAVIAINRYVLTCRPFSKVNSIITNHIKGINVGISMSSIGISLWIPLYESYNERSRICVPGSSFVVYILKSIVGLVFAAMFLIGTVCYIKVALAIRERHKLMVMRKLNTSNSSCPNAGKSPSVNNQDSCGMKVGCMSGKGCKNKIMPESLAALTGPTVTRTSLAMNSATLSDTKHEGKQCQENLGGILTPGSKDENSTSEMAETASTSYKRLSPAALAALLKEERTINRVTLMLFLITLVYIISWLLHWCSLFSATNNIVKEILFSLKHAFMVNCAINPIVYSLMSSKYRSRVISLFKR